MEFLAKHVVTCLRLDSFKCAILGTCCLIITIDNVVHLIPFFIAVNDALLYAVMNIVIMYVYLCTGRICVQVAHMRPQYRTW